jgi:diaminohydroxyphosphoribosylaminopyrimidine deaminase/5-amino-6-(5-phosphoribosylamino)uracil reductase
MRFEPSEADLMRRAVELSILGAGRVEPNPRVGAVVISGAGEIVGEAYHQRFGAAHAEIEALRRAGTAAEGGTLFVTLEPCSHEGKTPPCTRGILEAGIRRVVVANRDPNPEASGGVEALQERGVRVECGLLADEAARANAPFLWWHSTGESFLALKLAVSLDGKIAELPGARSDVTGAEASTEVMRLRSAADAILIGSGTAVADDPLLTVRDESVSGRVPTRVVLDSAARVSPGSRLVRSVDEAPLLLFVAESADPGRVARLEAAGAAIERIPGTATEIREARGVRLDLGSVLTRLRDLGMRSVLCEGGAGLADALLATGRVQRLHWHLAPRVIGPRGVPALTSADIGEWRLAGSRPAGDDMLIVWDHVRLASVLKGA